MSQQPAPDSKGQGFKPPRSLTQAIWRCRKRAYRRECLRWLRFGPTPKQLAVELEFKAPDNLWQVVWYCRDRRYVKEYVKWLRFGPDEARDAKKFEEQWSAAQKDGNTNAVARYYLRQLTRRQTSLTHHKTDVMIFYTIVAAIFAFLATIAPEWMRDLIGQSRVPVTGLMLIAVVMALASYTNKLLYPLYTHFRGAAEYGHDVVHDKSDINSVRKEVNELARTVQRGKRLFSVSKLCIYAAGAYLALKHYL